MHLLLCDVSVRAEVAAGTHSPEQRKNLEGASEAIHELASRDPITRQQRARLVEVDGVGELGCDLVDQFRRVPGPTKGVHDLGFGQGALFLHRASRADEAVVVLLPECNDTRVGVTPWAAWPGSASSRRERDDACEGHKLVPRP
jgi:hypothetical protein